MSARITVNGIEITVNTSELGEAMKQLAPWLSLPAAAVPPGPKAKEVWPFPTGSKPEAARVPAQSSLALPIKSVAAPEGISPARRALDLFHAIRDHRASGGLMPTEVMKILGAAHPKGTGSRMQGINRLLAEAGINHADVYRNDRNRLGDRTWTPGPKIDQAIALIESMVTSK